MMEDADYQDKLCLDDIKDAVAALDEAAVWFSIFWSGWANERIFAQPGKSPVEAAHIGLARLVAKHCNAILVDFAKVGDCGIGKFNFSHASRAVWR